MNMLVVLLHVLQDSKAGCQGSNKIYKTENKSNNFPYTVFEYNNDYSLIQIQRFIETFHNNT